MSESRGEETPGHPVHSTQQLTRGQSARSGWLNAGRATASASERVLLPGLVEPPATPRGKSCRPISAMKTLSTQRSHGYSVGRHTELPPKEARGGHRTEVGR